MRSKEKNVANVIRWRNNNRKKWNGMQRRYSLVRRRKVHIEVIQLLGGKCSNPNCLVPNRCSDIRCLQIDHVNGDGYKERISKGAEMYYKHILKQIKTGSKDYQLLCANCNWIKRFENGETGGKNHRS